MWLGDNPLRLDSAEFRNQHMCILRLELYIKSMSMIIESFNCLLSHVLGAYCFACL